MMKKFLWIGGIVVAVIVIIVVTITIVVRNYLKSENLKALIIPKIEETTGREVNIQSIDVSLFKGIVVNGIAIKSPDKKENTLEVDRFILDYSLIPLLKRQLVIKEIRLDSPHILIRRNREGVFSVEDIFKHKEKVAETEKPKKSHTEKASALPVSIITDNIIVDDAQISFIDAKKEIPDIKGVSDMVFEIAIKRGAEFPEVKGRLNLKRLSIFINNREIKTTGKIDIEKKNIAFSLESLIDTDKVKLQGSLNDYLTTPRIEANLYSARLDLEKLLGLVPLKKEKIVTKTRAHKEPPSKARKTTPLNITAHGKIKVDRARYMDYDIKDFYLTYRYKNEILTIESLRCKIVGGDKIEAQGSAEGRFTMKYSPSSGDPFTVAKKTLKGVLIAKLSKGQIKKSKIGDAIAAFTGLKDLRRLTFRDALFKFDIANQKIGITGNVNSDYIEIVPKGVVDFSRNADLKADTKVAPSLTHSLSGKVRIPELFTDNRGWTVIPLKITGKVDDPLVSLDTSGIKKEIKKKIRQEIKKELMKRLSPSRDGQKSHPEQDILKGIFGQ